jgi:hypothetical protein
MGWGRKGWEGREEEGSGGGREGEGRRKEGKGGKGGGPRTTPAPPKLISPYALGYKREALKINKVLVRNIKHLSRYLITMKQQRHQIHAVESERVCTPSEFNFIKRTLFPSSYRSANECIVRAGSVN